MPDGFFEDAGGYYAPEPDEGLELNFIILLVNVFIWTERLSGLERSPEGPVRRTLAVNNEMVSFITTLLTAWGFFE